MTKKTPFAIGKMVHRFRGDIPSFEVTTFLSYYDFGTEYYAGSKVGGESYTLMANTWRFVRYSETDDDGMNKESEIIDELIEDERHDCDPKPEKTEWIVGEKPPCGVWLDCHGLASGCVIDTVMFRFIGDKWAIAQSKLERKAETPIAWTQYTYRIHVDPREKALAQIAFALANVVIGFDAASEIDFGHDNDYSRDYRGMAKFIINGDIPLTKYTGDE
ncbi:hypothetical protein AX154_003245 [Escherichia coli]|uniref:hypothetical protein n=1 Tax=Escherichia coli TaxID=562 RepID=UPI000BE586B9|nr:hypothetical protein [Escherichia coli]EES7787949.1 hypothetical protein [Escherichia coli]EES9994405.1 hypothetical protein [Escherichia coli]EET7201921.1 hypothetical protein [Escherichia coli]EEU2867376.1 hypothetical protein [Escherichia coli]EEV3247877.1 hypothetical protein [Escherichia coli]